jgi:molecular chaperone GrpE
MDGTNKKDKEKEEINSEAEVVEALPAPTPEEKLADELKQTNDRLMRLAAEFDNFKKISARENANSLKFANENLIASILPILDNLEQAVSAGRSLDQASAKNLLIGVEMVLKQMIEVLQKFGVEFYASEGQPFDPARHEAVAEEEKDGVEPGTVVSEYQKGYLLHGRLLRPARVTVSKRA